MEAQADGDEVRTSEIGWPRALVTAVVTTVVALALLAYGTNALLTELSGLERGQRVGVATAFFAVVLTGLLVTLRRLQGRGAI